MESRKTALEVVHLFIINKAENRLHDERISISEIAYELEFENPSYFSRLLKKTTGRTAVKFSQSLD